MPVARSLVLPSRGRLLISTDLHGNWADYDALARRFEGALAAGVDVRWALLGDLVHGPDDAAAQREPRLYGYPDESGRVVDAVVALQARAPDRVHVLLGNHDAGHVGLKRTSKFHPDEVQALEDRLSAAQRARLRSLFEGALLAAVAPCGLWLSHGAPGDAVQSLAQLDGPLPPDEADVGRWAAVHELLWSYGQRGAVAQALLDRVSDEVGFPLHVIVHGHDRDEAGWFTEGGNQCQPVIFGAPHDAKRALWVDLSLPITSLDDVERQRVWVHGDAGA